MDIETNIDDMETNIEETETNIEMNNGISQEEVTDANLDEANLKNSEIDESNENSIEVGHTDNQSITNLSGRRSLRTKEVQVSEKKPNKRKSISSSETPKTRIPKYEAIDQDVTIELKSKTITLPGNSNLGTLDREKLTIIPPKEGAFEVGDLIWAKLQGYPFWPCMVTIDPITGTYSKISGTSYKADRVYHIQYFGAQAYRGWTLVGMVLPFEGSAKFYEKVNAEIESSPQKSASKVSAKYFVKNSYKKKLNHAILECEQAMKLDQVDRVLKLTFNYVYADSKRKPEVQITPNNKSDKTTSKRVKKTPSKKSQNLPQDIYDFDEDSDGFANEPLPGLMFPKRNAKGDFQVYLRQHFDDESKANPNKSKSEVTDILKNKWDLLGEDIRSLYVERKALYVDESNMLVSKRSNFDDDYFNDSDCDYNDSEGDANDQNDTNENADHKTNNSTQIKKRSKSKKSEKLFDKIKNEDTVSLNDESLNTPKRKSIIAKPSSSSVKTPARKSTAKTEAHVPSPDSINKQLLVSEESSDETPGDSTKNVDEFCHSCGDSGDNKNRLVTCDGICKRSYHQSCADLTVYVEKWLCKECSTNSYICFACKNPDNLDTKKCEDSKCTKFYHLSCIVSNYPIKVNESGNSFLCPLHKCINCHLESLEDNENRESKRQLLKCFKCPTACHAKNFCIGAGTMTISKNYVMCPDHWERKNKDRHINVNYCFACSSGGNLICCESCPAAFHEECLDYTLDHDKSFFCTDCRWHKQLHYGEIVWVKLGIYRWWPGEICHPNNVPINVLNLKHNDCDFPVYFFGSHDYCWVNKTKAFLFAEGDLNKVLTSQSGGKSNQNKSLKNTFKSALKEATEKFEIWKKSRKEMSIATIASKPSPYQSISSNRYFNTKNNSSNGESDMHICECKPKTPEEDLCVDESCLNRMSLIECDPKFCPAGEKCKNQRFKKCEYVKCKPFRTKSAGWGLMSLEDIKQGQFVIEYCGEIIDDKECDKRLKDNSTKQSNFYFLTIDKDNIIDAGPKGNLARFLNHSCEPNCISQKWVVNNVTRVGIFALQDIPSNSELTFNYNLDCRGNDQIKCVCGSSNCSGFIGVSTNKPKNGKPKIVEKPKLSKTPKTKSFNKMHEDRCFKCGNHGELIMCDMNGCPKSYHLDCIKLNSVPKNDWFCPKHSCMNTSCKQAPSIFCSVCTNSVCKTHKVTYKILKLPDGEFLCEDHIGSDNNGLITESEVNGVAEDK